MACRALSRIVQGKVMHFRRRPFENRFVYPVFYLLFNCDEFDKHNSWLFGVNRRRPLSLHFEDYGDGGDPRLWLRALLKQQGVTDCPGTIWLHSFPRVFGYAFNPVNFWYCERADGSIGAVVAEVNNTFGDRHCYLLRLDAERAEDQTLQAIKQMHVSPFYPVEGEYQFKFKMDFDAPHVWIDYLQSGELQLNTAIWGKSKPLTVSALFTALLKQPLLTVGVMVRIHWQALRLWLKGATFHQRPTPSSEEISR
ncbi:DUF1365 domain-containing protein [Sedimenticola selenatireducens]|uniref:DUF1365 domain-containing protein n=1 Tax=Sedimenticola selenatireducens TaxID=191960 RepID=A0A557SKI6_9GAMM|nr:DUF1365 domain-containing protein [Sedimenticola selenatireducens]TVO77903.1 DUF1365 domain-containing protein [Sedimenticola selenatireducens]TVT65208.1 MAG: DUF1365 domain-containing protein [Sedimenticola selenatireducens]